MAKKHQPGCPCCDICARLSECASLDCDIDVSGVANFNCGTASLCTDLNTNYVATYTGIVGGPAARFATTWPQCDGGTGSLVVLLTCSDFGFNLQMWFNTLAGIELEAASFDETDFTEFLDGTAKSVSWVGPGSVHENCQFNGSSAILQLV